MTVSVAQPGRQNPIPYLLQTPPGADGGKAGAAVTSTNAAATISPELTASPQSLTALASFLTQIGRDETPPDQSAPHDGSDPLLSQLENDLKDLFSQFQPGGTRGNSAPDASGNSAAPNAAIDRLLADLTGTDGGDPSSEDAGDNLLSRLESDLKSLFADLHSPGRPGWTTQDEASGTLATGTDSARVSRVIDAYAADGPADGAAA